MFRYLSRIHLLLESHTAVYTDLSLVAVVRWSCASSNTYIVQIIVAGSIHIQIAINN